MQTNKQKKKKIDEMRREDVGHQFNQIFYGRPPLQFVLLH